MEQYKRVVELWQSYKITSASALDQYLDNFRILFAYHSGKIENEEITYHDTKGIFESGRVTNYTGSVRALLEQGNQKLCYELMKGKVIGKESLSLDLIREIHRVLTAGTYNEYRYVINRERPGEFKKYNYGAGGNAGAAVKDMENSLTELVAEVNAYADENALRAAAHLHGRFELVHPFADGNGRTGRILTNYYLMTHNHPPIIVFNEDKQKYYECLQTYDKAGDTDSLYEFFKVETEKTWAKTLALADGMRPERKNLSDFIQNM